MNFVLLSSLLQLSIAQSSANAEAVCSCWDDRFPVPVRLSEQLNEHRMIKLQHAHLEDKNIVAVGQIVKSGLIEQPSSCGTGLMVATYEMVMVPEHVLRGPSTDSIFFSTS